MSSIHKRQAYWLQDRQIDEILSKAEEARVTAGMGLDVKIGGSPPLSPAEEEEEEKAKKKVVVSWDGSLGTRGAPPRYAPPQATQQSNTFWADSTASFKDMPSLVNIAAAVQNQQAGLLEGTALRRAKEGYARARHMGAAGY